MMNRRDVLKGFAGLIFAPLIKLDLTHERDLSALVNEFCAKEGDFRRYDVASPFAWSGESVATDAFSLISVPGLQYTATGDKAKRPNVGYVFDSFWPTVEETSWRRWRHMPTLSPYLHTYSYCRTCDRHAPRCGECDGEGDMLGPFGESIVKCERCDGLGYLPQASCPICHGIRNGFASHELWGADVIDARYGMLLRQIPGAMWMPGKNNESPILVRGDGGIRAMVMQLRKG